MPEFRSLLSAKKNSGSSANSESGVKLCGSRASQYVKNRVWSSWTAVELNPNSLLAEITEVGLELVWEFCTR